MRIGLHKHPGAAAPGDRECGFHVIARYDLVLVGDELDEIEHDRVGAGHSRLLHVRGFGYGHDEP